MAEAQNLQEYRTHKTYLKSCNVYKNNKKLREYYKRWERQKEVYYYVSGNIVWAIHYSWNTLLQNNFLWYMNNIIAEVGVWLQVG